MLRVIWVANSVDVIFNMTEGGPAYANANAVRLHLPKGEGDEPWVFFDAGGAFDGHSHVRCNTVHDLLIPHGGGFVNEKQDEEKKPEKLYRASSLRCLWSLLIFSVLLDIHHVHQAGIGALRRGRYLLAASHHVFGV